MIGILNAYQFDPTPGTYQEEYTVLINQFVKTTFPRDEVRNYQIPFGDWPDNIDDCRFWIITGSPKSAYDVDPWIRQLKQFILTLHQQKKSLIGICFGHQIIAEALGGKVERSPHGWSVGIKNFEIIQSKPWMKPSQKKIALLFSHQDKVTQLPPEAELLAKDELCPYQMFQIGEHILTIQGHPEFNAEFARARLIARKEKIKPEIFASALLTFDNPEHSQLFAQWLRHFVAA